MKDVAKRINSLQVDVLGRTPESILHSVEVKDIPVKSYHTLFCPTYVLDARFQSAGCTGPPKLEPSSLIGVYLGHSPFHAGIVALVWNPNTGKESTQYHVFLDDYFSTVLYMGAGTLPQNWEDLVKYLSDMATTKDVNLTDTCLNGQSEEKQHSHI